MLFWHVGGTIAAIRYAFRDDRMDLRLLIAGAVLPDLIDTPPGLIGWSSFGGVRLIGHSLVFAGLVMALVLVATRRGRPRKRWMPLAIGLLMHLVLDAVWADPETLWWPFLGWEFAQSVHASAGEFVLGVLSDWTVWALEVAGLVYLGFLARRGNLKSVEARSRFFSTGQIAVPIDRG